MSYVYAGVCTQALSAMGAKGRQTQRTKRKKIVYIYIYMYSSSVDNFIQVFVI